MVFAAETGNKIVKLVDTLQQGNTPFIELNTVNGKRYFKNYE
jgi:hypothetical protein